MRWRLFTSELVGTALLVLGGVSFVILMSGEGSPMAHILPNAQLRTIVTALLFGCVGSAIAVSPVGKESGAHINPAVTMGFWLMRKLDGRTAVGYVVAQIVGGCVGALPLLLWGSMGRSIGFGATMPGPGYSATAAIVGEAIATGALIATLCMLLGFRHLRGYTPFVIPWLYAVMVPLEAPISGTSTNPARTFGPALISGTWDGWWVYWIGPGLGVVVAVLLCSRLAKRIEVAKLYHFESDRRRLFHRMAGSVANPTASSDGHSPH
ncbi:MAG TPA: aquaporin [Vicinamibacterales bacterium]|nr:aquaporin [Vicinamibacterales bacterium]